MLAGRSRTASIVSVMTTSAEWNLRPCRSAFIGERDKTRTVGDPMSTKGGVKRWSVASQVPLGHEQSDVQGRCRVATANASCAKAQDAYDELNRVNDDQASPCSGFCLQLHFLRWIPCEKFHLNNKKIVQAPPCLLTVLSQFFLSWRYRRGVFQVADCRFSCGSYGKHHVSSPVMIRLRNVELSYHYWSRNHKSCDHHVDLASGCVAHCAG